MRIRNGIRAAVAAAVLAFAQAADAKTFKWAFQGDVATMDPHGLFETMTLGFQANIYEGLVIKDRDMVTVGSLATSWESIDSTTWRFHLRQGVKFHNGADFTAEDVAFSVQRIRSEGSDLKVIAGMIAEVKIIDDYTVDLITPAPDPILPIQLEIFYIMDKDWAEEHKTAAATNLKGGEEGNFANLNANGTGPFMLKERQPGIKTVLVRNPNWWGTMDSNVTEAIFTPIGQNATRVAALIASISMAWAKAWRTRTSLKGFLPLMFEYRSSSRTWSKPRKMVRASGPVSGRAPGALLRRSQSCTGIG